MTSPYRGRFAPSPTGPLHAGSMVAALASWLDARAHGGRWLVRIEDVDTPRCVAGMDTVILRQLADCGLQPDEPPVWQSTCGARYQAALDRLVATNLAYPCGCTRADIAEALARAGHGKQRHGELVYPGTCRSGLHGKPPRAVRLRTDLPSVECPLNWRDRRLGVLSQDVAAQVGDFVLRRADGLWAYQLAVVVDDDAQGITDVVRGEDLADNTPRQILLQRLLGVPTPRYLHVPLVRDAQGEKLSKQTGAAAADTASRPLDVLRAAGDALGLHLPQAGSPAEWLGAAVNAWADTWCVVSGPRPPGR